MRIYGSKGGGGSSHTPVEAPETGRSKQIVNIVEIVSEGEIDGLYDGMKSVYLDDTAVQNADGSYNFNNVSGQLNVGTQDQGVLDGYESSQNEVSVGVEVKKSTGEIVRTITDERITRLRFTIGVKMLYEQNSQGDTNSTGVTLRIKVGSKTQDYVINGKYSSQYLEAVEFDNLPAVPFNISVERITADSNKNTLQNGTIWSVYTEIIDTEFCYPNTAIAGVSFDSDYFNGIPTRNYLVRGIKVRVPSNYDPETRTYTGLWDGTFKIAWTDNPAWVLMDVITNERYGLGGLLGSFSCDKWTLYDIARYCDTLVDDGFGGKEPRFTCNAWITDVTDAYTLLNNICSIFRAIPVWTGQEYSVVIDRPSDPTWTYTNANVVDGIFERSYSAKKSRHNAVKVTYADKNNAYKSAVEYVSDDESIQRNGLNLTEITAFGCTSRGQAYRTGRWLIETEKLEKETITFTVGREGLMHLPGDIIRVSDNHYAGLNVGGRIVSVSGNKVTLDREVKISGTTNLTYINKSAQETTIRITAASGNVVTLASTPTDIEPMTVWSLSTSTVTSGLYKAISLAENEDGTFKITALQHEPQKEAIVDKSAHFVPTNKTAYRAPSITGVGTTTGYDGKLYVTVETSSGDGVVTYDVRIVKDGALYEYRRGLKDPNIALENLPNGEYTITIYAKNAKGQIVSERTTSFTIDKPPAPTGVIVTGGLGEITIEWDWVDDVTYTEIFASEDDKFANAVKVTKTLSKLYSHSVGAEQTRYYWLRHVRGINNGPFYQEAGIEGKSAVDIDDRLAKLNDELAKNIVDEVIDTALPARNLELIKTVTGINVDTFLNYNQVYNTTDGKLYTWDGTKYVDNSVDVGKLQIPTKQLTGTISAAQIGANVIGTNHLGANAVTADKIAADSITSAKIQAGAIKADHIAAGELTADKLAIGLGGNLLQNPIFANNGYDWKTMSKGSGLDSSTTFSFARRSYLSTSIPWLDTENGVYIMASNNITSNSTVRIGFVYKTLKLNPDSYYMFSAYCRAANCYGALLIEEVDDSGAYVAGVARSNNTSSTIINTLATKGLTDDHRLYVKFKSPSTGLVRLGYYVSSVFANTSYQDADFLRPMLEECTEYTTQSSAWQPSGVTSVHGGSIVTNTITAQQIAAGTITANEIATGAIAAKHIAAGSISASHIVSKSLTSDKLNVSTLSAISANMGNITAGSLNIASKFIVSSSGAVEIRGASGNVGMIIRNDRIDVYDASGNLKVRLGKLT
ncbi:host specificity protein J [Basfia succiniciproducens]|uniref:host specificity protein J n=1 Tax=Basfia succiniciproducens TaxID=653940 RepID=UPI003FCECF21